MAEIKINERQITMLIDTGSSINTIPENIYKEKFHRF